MPPMTQGMTSPGPPCVLVMAAKAATTTPAPILATPSAGARLVRTPSVIASKAMTTYRPSSSAVLAAPG